MHDITKDALTLLQTLVRTANKLDRAYQSTLEEKKNPLSEDEYEALMESIHNAEHFLYANGSLKDKNGESIPLGSKLKSPHLFDDAFDVLELKKDDDGMVYYKNHTDGSDYAVGFLGSSEVILIKEPKS